MAGGYGRSDQGRLVDRIDATLTQSAALNRSPARHCFVEGEPALLVEWRQGSDGWEGRVVSMARIEGAWATLERWLPAASITAGTHG